MKRRCAASLLDHLRPSEADGPLRSAVFSTYSLAVEGFFEQELLPALLGLGGLGDRGRTAPAALERKLADVEYCGLVADAHALAQGGRPSLHVEISAPAGRTQHSKVTLLHWERRVRVVVSSANLGDEGYRLQREAAVVLDWTPDRGPKSAVLRDSVAEWTDVLGTSATERFQRALNGACRAVEEWERSRPASAADIRIHFGGGQVPLWRRIAEAWPRGEPLHRLWICSPFWPSTGPLRTPFEALAAGLQARGSDLTQAEIHVVTRGDAPGERSQPRFPFQIVEDLRRRRFPIARGRIVPARLDALDSEVPKGMAAGARELHAKWIALEGARSTLLVLGSANFTRKGLGVVNRRFASIEACVFVNVKGRAADPESWLPPIAGEGVRWEACTAGQLAAPDPEEDDRMPWPPFLASVELRLGDDARSGEQGDLVLHVADSRAPAFEVRLPDPDGTAGALLCAPLAGVAPPPVALHATSIRALLAARAIVVRWDDKEAVFPLNVADESRVALPAVLGARPTESDLLEYFTERTSAEDIIDRVFARMTSREPPAAALPTNDAERARELQNYVIREFVESLRGLASILTESTRSARAFEHAVLGEMSPVALARQVLAAAQSGRRSPTAGTFQLVELLRLLSADFPDVLDREQRDRMTEVRDRAIERIVKGLASVAETSGVQRALADRHFAAYVRASLPARLAEDVLRTGIGRKEVAL